MKKYIKIRNEIYPFKVHVFLNYKNIADVKRDLRVRTKNAASSLHKLLDEIKYEHCRGYTIDLNGNIVILIRTFNGSPDCHDILNHEINHAVDFSGGLYRHGAFLRQPRILRLYARSFQAIARVVSKFYCVRGSSPYAGASRLRDPPQ